MKKDDDKSKMNIDHFYMVQALKEAEKAFADDEVPVGAVIVMDGKILSRGRNRRDKTKDATKHAEMTAIERACKKTGDWRLNGATLYVTLEPCAMCAGAAVNARISKIVFGAYEPKAGCCGSALDVPKYFTPNHVTLSYGGVMREECSCLISDYFKTKRKNPL